MKFSVFLSMIAFFFLAAACAPRQESEPSSAEGRGSEASGRSNEEEDSPEPVVSGESETKTSKGSRATPEPAEEGPDGGEEPDWSGRYYALKEKYESEFSPPEPGRPIELKLSSGSTMSGTLVALTEKDLVLDLGHGQVTFGADALDPMTAKSYFAPAYGAYHARKQAIEEYQRWQAKHRPAPVTPEPGEVSSPPRSSNEEETRKRKTPWFIPQDSEDPMFRVEPGRKK